MQFTEKSRIKDILKSPVGKDILSRIFMMIGRENMSENKLFGLIRLNALPKVVPQLVDAALVKSIVNLLNSNTEELLPGSSEIKKAWWKTAVFYQIYPRSFSPQKSLRQVLDKLDYLKELGISAIWLSPIYDSPLADNGYDIRDYRKIAEDMGTMEEFEALLAAVHARGMRLIMDLVVNHTSDQHDWFKKSLKKEAPYDNYYIWKKGSPPNNWQSVFGGSAWSVYPGRDEQALHIFAKTQMDLNWECDALRREILDMMAWWMDKGIDGFRLDVINLISKASGLPNGNEVIGRLMGYRGAEHYFYGPRLHEYLREMNEKVLSPKNAFTVGEMPGIGAECSKLLTADYRKELDTYFSFDHLENPGRSRWSEYEYDLNYAKKFFMKQSMDPDKSLHPTLFFENHDNPRMVGKVTKNPEHESGVAKVLAAILLTQRGTPFIFQGQELGITNVDFDSIDEIKDVESINFYESVLKQSDVSNAMRVVNAGSREHARRVIDWSWADEQKGDSHSVLEFYKALLKIRNGTETFAYGDFTPVKPNERDLFCYYRQYCGEKFYIEMNIGKQTKKQPVSTAGFELLLSSCPDGDLPPYSARIYKVKI